jgi:YbbR domain-containing protein
MAVEPSRVTVEGPERVIAQYDEVETEAVDLAAVRSTESQEKRLLSPAPQLKVLHDMPVRIRVAVSSR